MTSGQLMSSQFAESRSLLSVAAILTAFVGCWLLLAGSTPQPWLLVCLFWFMTGSVCWSAACQQIWPSDSSLNSYLPLGYGIASLVSFVLIMLRLGTLPACALGSGFGAISWWLSTRTASAKEPAHSSDVPAPSANAAAFIPLLLTGAYATFLMADQLISAADLRDVSTATTIHGWVDLIVHSNTVLSFSFLPFGSAPISTFDHTQTLLPYHYGSYILASLLTTASGSVSPFLAYLALVSPLGLWLLLLPFADRLLLRPRSGRLEILLLIIAILIVVYSSWVRLISYSLLDPLWLLITSPATLYACAIVLSGLQIASSCRSSFWQLRFGVGLSLAVLLILIFFKVQVAHALLLAVLVAVILTIRLRFRASGDRGPVGLRLPLLITALFITSHLLLNRILGIARANPVQDWLKFLTDLAAVTWKENLPFVDQLTLLPPLAAGLGVLTLCGPLFLAFWVLAARSHQTRPLSSQLMALLIVSFLAGQFVGPPMVWDAAEFQNRSWPMLWCIGAWGLAGWQPRLALQRHRLLTGLLVVALLVFATVLLPQQKSESAASPPLWPDWTIKYYPILISSSDKQSAAALKAQAVLQAEVRSMREGKTTRSDNERIDTMSRSNSMPITHSKPQPIPSAASVEQPADKPAANATPNAKAKTTGTSTSGSSAQSPHGPDYNGRQYFFAANIVPTGDDILYDQPSLIAGLSGSRPVISKLGFQRILTRSKRRQLRFHSVESRYQDLLRRSRLACAQTHRTASDLVTIEGDADQRDLPIVAVCKQLG